MARKYTDEELKLLTKLLSYTDRYDISIQFWVDQTAVYISKGGVDLESYGGDAESTFQQSIDYLKRINREK